MGTNYFFVVEKVRGVCHAKASHIFSEKNGSVFAYNVHVFDNFNVSLTNKVVTGNFEQLGPYF